MTNSGRSLHDAALDAAADLLLSEQETSGPPAPAIASVCQALGIGVSTFYQVFENKRDFDIQLASHRLWTAYEQGRRALVKELATAEELHDNHGPVDADEVLTAMLSAFYDKDGADLAEAILLPWINSEAMSTAYKQTTDTQVAFYLPIAVGFFDAAGIDASVADADAFARTLFFASLATSFTPLSDTPHFVTAAVDVLTAAFDPPATSSTH